MPPAPTKDMSGSQTWNLDREIKREPDDVDDEDSDPGLVIDESEPVDSQVVVKIEPETGDRAEAEQSRISEVPKRVTFAPPGVLLRRRHPIPTKVSNPMPTHSDVGKSKPHVFKLSNGRFVLVDSSSESSLTSSATTRTTSVATTSDLDASHQLFHRFQHRNTPVIATSSAAKVLPLATSVKGSTLLPWPNNIRNKFPTVLKNGLGSIEGQSLPKLRLKFANQTGKPYWAY